MWTQNSQFLQLTSELKAYLWATQKPTSGPLGRCT